MKLVNSSDNERVQLSVSKDELHLLFGLVNEFRNGPFALSDEDWNMVMTAYDRLMEVTLLADLRRIVDEIEPDDDLSDL